MRDFPPATSLDGLDWRPEPPDAEGWWWVRDESRAPVVATAVRNRDGALRVLMPGGAVDAGHWPAGWRCAPVVTPRTVAERCRSMVKLYGWAETIGDALDGVREAITEAFDLPPEADD